MKITFLGAAHEVTGSATLLEACGRRMLIDCGMEQGADLYENAELPIAPGMVDCVLLTHAHIDHSGKLPALVRGGFGGPVYATEASRQLCSMMLLDSAHIQESEAEWRNRKAKRSGDDPYVPLYTCDDVERTMQLFVPLGYHEEKEIFPGISIRFLDAGHLLGSASIELTVCEAGTRKVLLFSGDIGNVDRPLIRDPEKPEYADVVVIESTYGNRLHGARPDYLAQLTSVLQSTLDRGGNVVIPAFAVGRTQELLYLIHRIKKQGLVRGHDGFPVYVDSPMAVEATHIYRAEDDMMPFYDEETRQLLARGEDVLDFPGLHLAVSAEESMAINADKTPKVILSASGMCEAGRIRHHLKHNLWRPACTVLFVGYQSEGTLGRTLAEGAPYVSLFGEEVQVRAEICRMEGISGHADRDMLLSWLSALKKKPQTVFVNHGADEVCDEFALAVREKLGIDAVAPYSGACYDLLTGRTLVLGNQVKKDKKASAVRRKNSVYERLLAAGRRLMAIIEKSRGGANKDLAKLTGQIEDLCAKWEK